MRNNRDVPHEGNVVKENQKEALTASVIPCSARPITYDEEKCVGCNRCAEACQMDVLIPSVNRGEHPIVMYPGECMYCGACVMDCPVPGAIHLEHPLMNRTKFVSVKC